MALIKMPNSTNLAVIAINGAYNLDLKFNTYFVLCINNDECDNDKFSSLLSNSNFFS